MFRRDTYFSLAVVAGFAAGCGGSRMQKPLPTLTTQPARSQPAAVAPKESGGPEPLAGFADDGVFHLYVNETPIYSCEAHWAASGAYRHSGTLTMAGQSVNVELKHT